MLYPATKQFTSFTVHLVPLGSRKALCGNPWRGRWRPIVSKPTCHACKAAI